jgi:hypothetical protein
MGEEARAERYLRVRRCLEKLMLGVFLDVSQRLPGIRRTRSGARNSLGPYVSAE